jgi:class 3 adenylate cyclase
MYDVKVERRQKRMLRSATQSSAIVSSLFPSNDVRDRLYATQQRPKEAAFLEKKQKLRHYLAGMNVEMNETVEESDEYAYGSKPIADLFPQTTIMFADIAGFTAWSSVRVQFIHRKKPILTTFGTLLVDSGTIPGVSTP